MFRGSRGTQTTSLRVSVNPQSIQRGGEETYGVPRIGRASNSDGTQQKGVLTMGQGIGTGEPTLIDSIYDDEAAPTAEEVAKVVAKVAGAGAGNTLQGRRIAVVGLGYVGLPTALSLADHGAEIIGCDISESRLAEIKSRQVDLLGRDRERLARHLEGELVKLTTEPSAVSSAEAIVVCVPTPIDAHQSPDLRALLGACASVVDNAVVGQTIVLTSTTYVGCTRELVVEAVAGHGDLRSAGMCSSRSAPSASTPASRPMRRIPHLGWSAASRRHALRGQQSCWRHTASAIHRVSSPEAAEMTKLVENTFRAVNIALANEFSDAAKELNVDVIEVITAAATKPYGFMPFYPGPGVGGHCIPCDPHYLLWQLRARRFDSPVMRTAMTAIALRPREVVSQARRMLAEKGCATSGSHVLVVGVTYKPGVADIRESPALEIIDELAAAGAAVAFTDPLIESLETPHAGRLSSHRAPGEDTWDLVLIHTRHTEDDLAWVSVQPTVLDTTYR